MSLSTDDDSDLSDSADRVIDSVDELPTHFVGEMMADARRKYLRLNPPCHALLGMLLAPHIPAVGELAEMVVHSPAGLAEIPRKLACGVGLAWHHRRQQSVLHRIRSTHLSPPTSR